VISICFFPGGAKLIKGGDLVIECLPEVKREIPECPSLYCLGCPPKHKLRKRVAALDWRIMSLL